MDSKTCPLVLFIICGLSIFTIAIISYLISPPQSNDEVITYSDHVIKEVYKKPILEIFLSKENCQFPYKNLEMGKLPTIGYSCLSGEKMNPLNVTQSILTNKFWKKAKRKSCNYDEQSGDYIGNIIYPSSKLETKIYTWRGSFICIREMENDLSNLMIVPSLQNCASDYKKCDGFVDESGSSICVLKFNECPINFIAVIDLNRFDVPKNLNAKIQKFNDNSGLALVTSTHESNILPDYKYKILTSINISEGYPCAFPFERSKPFTEASNLYKNFEQYNRCSRKIENLNYDPNITPLDSNYGVFVYGDAFDYYLNLPNNPLNSFLKKDWVLSYNNYPTLNNSCKNIFILNEQKYIDKKENFEKKIKLKSYKISNKISEIKSLSIVLVIFTSYSFSLLMSDLNSNCGMFNTIIIIIVLFGILCCCLAVCTFSFNVSSLLNEFALGIEFYYKLDKNCFDNHYQQVFDFPNKEASNIIKLFKIIGLMHIFSIIFTFMFFVVTLQIIFLKIGINH